LFNDLFGASQVQLEKTTSIFENLMHMMKNELENNPEVFHQDVLKNYLHTFLMLAERERRKQKVTELRKGADFDYTLLFKDLLEAGYKRVKQVSSYASQLSVTKKRLNQATTRVLGKSPKNIIDERVILEAKRLLVHTHENIKEIGYVLGFQDPAYFIKFFRKHCGITPVAFREQALG
jgi:AraC family transcriptional activator of pobA